MIEPDKNTKKILKLITNTSISDIKLLKQNNTLSKSTYKLFKTNHPGSKQLVLYFYGGGYFLPPSKKQYELCSLLAEKLSSDVMLIFYPLAPEYKFPQNIIETKKMLTLIAKNELAAYNDIFIIGESSGGNLITSILMTGYKIPKCKGLILLYPSLDYYKQDYPSKLLFDSFGINQDIRNFYSSTYLKPLENKQNPLLSPIYSNNFHYLPKISLHLAELDPLKDEALLFSQKLVKHQVSHEVFLHKYTIHNYFSFKIEPHFTKTIASIKAFIDQ